MFLLFSFLWKVNPPLREELATNLQHRAETYSLKFGYLLSAQEVSLWYYMGEAERRKLQKRTNHLQYTVFSLL